MSDYCTNCKWLTRQTNAGKTLWLCFRNLSKNGITWNLTSLCGNPAKRNTCKVESWYEDRSESKVHKLVTEHSRAMQFIVDKILEQQEKKMTTEEQIKVMQAYVDGKQIQIQIHDKTWENIVKDPTWNWFKNNYRIKPEPKYRQLKPEELIELKGKWLKDKDSKNIAIVTGVDSIEGGVNMLGTWWTGKELFLDWTYEDGTPCGKLEE